MYKQVMGIYYKILYRQIRSDDIDKEWADGYNILHINILFK